MRQILHISDVHFGPKHDPEVAAGVLRLVEQRRPDMVVISGDLTQRAKKRQFRAARHFVDSLPVPWLAVPGNHDVPMYRAWERALAPFYAYRKYFSPELEPVFEDDELFVVGVNTAYNWTIKDGRIRRCGLRRIADRLEAAPAGRFRLIVAHHQLVPAPRFERQRVLAGARRAVEVFSRGGVEMVLSGHLHQSYVALSEAYYPSGRHPFLIVHAGTTTSRRGRGNEKRRCTCNWLRVDPTEITVSHLFWDRGQQSFLPWSRHHFPRRREPYALEDR